MNQQIEAWAGAVTSYLAVGIANAQEITANWDWLAIGAGILLLARLVQDVPKAFIYLKGLFKRKDNGS